VRAASLTACTARAPAHGWGKPGDAASQEAVRNPGSHAPLSRRSLSPMERKCGSKLDWGMENTQTQNTFAQSARMVTQQEEDDRHFSDAGKLVDRGFKARSRQAWVVGRAGVLNCKESCLRAQSQGGTPHAWGRKARLQLERQNRATFFHTTSVDRIHYPEIDIATY
jgi:hypothetical protein